MNIQRLGYFILIALSFSWAHASQSRLHVDIFDKSQSTVVCEKDPSCDFYICGAGKVLYYPGPLFGVRPVVFSETLDFLRVPSKIQSDGQMLFTNSNAFQYRLQGDPSVKEGPNQVDFFRNHGIMMSLYPQLMSCQSKQIAVAQLKISRGLQPLTPAFKSAGETAEKIKVSLAAKRILENFETQKSLQKLIEKSVQNTDYALDIQRDGCFARAQLFNAELQKAGIASLKIWLHGYGLWLNTKPRPEKFFAWRYHVANLVPLRTETGIELYVVDLSTSLVPVLLSDWLLSLQGPNQGFQLTQKVDENLANNHRQVQVSLSTHELFPLWQNSYQLPSQSKDFLSPVDEFSLIESLDSLEMLRDR